MMFMAVTSAFSSDLVCIASVVTYDGYRGYINPVASGGQLLKMSHFVVIGFATICACIAAGISTTAIGVNFIIVRVIPSLAFHIGEHVLTKFLLDDSWYHYRLCCVPNRVNASVAQAKHSSCSSCAYPWNCDCNRLLGWFNPPLVPYGTLDGDPIMPCDVINLIELF